MTKAIQTQVTNALTAATAYGDAIAALRKALHGQEAQAVRAEILPHVAKFYSVALVLSERTGDNVLDKDAPKYEAAKKAVQRLCKDIVGNDTERARTEPTKVRLSAEVKAAAAELLALCNGDIKRATAALKAVA